MSESLQELLTKKAAEAERNLLKTLSDQSGTTDLGARRDFAERELKLQSGLEDVHSELRSTNEGLEALKLGVVSQAQASHDELAGEIRIIAARLSDFSEARQDLETLGQDLFTKVDSICSQVYQLQEEREAMHGRLETLQSELVSLVKTSQAELTKDVRTNGQKTKREFSSLSSRLDTLEAELKRLPNQLKTSVESLQKKLRSVEEGLGTASTQLKELAQGAAEFRQAQGKLIKKTNDFNAALTPKIHTLSQEMTQRHKINQETQRRLEKRILIGQIALGLMVLLAVFVLK